MKEKSGKISKTIIGISVAALVLVSVLLGYFGRAYFDEKKKPEITSAGISEKIMEIGELASADLTYNGLVKYSEGEIPFIDLKSFSMIYRAEIKAGIDVSKISVEVRDDAVEIKLPEVEILSVEIDPDSIEFYDNTYALFNWTRKEDAVDAIKAAKEDVMEKADLETLKEKAELNAKKIISELLAETIGERELVFS